MTTDLDVRSHFGNLNNAAASPAPAPAMRDLLLSSLSLAIGVDVEKNAAIVRRAGHEVDGGSARRDAVLSKVAPVSGIAAKPAASFNNSIK